MRTRNPDLDTRFDCRHGKNVPLSEADLELEIAEVGHDDGVGVVGVGLGAEGQLEATRGVPCSSLETVA